MSISSGPFGGSIRIVGGPPATFADDDDDDDDTIPPEILQMMAMTEAIARGMAGNVGPGNIIVIEDFEEPPEEQKPEEPIVRQDESYDDIMARMDRLSEEVGTRPEDRGRYTHADS